MNRLKELRLERGLLQSDIAKIIGKKDRIIGFYESGERDPSTETLSILADFFNVSIDYLLGKTDIRISKQINLNEEEIAFASKIIKLNKENQETLKSIIDGLFAKQELENNKKDKDNEKENE